MKKNLSINEQLVGMIEAEANEVRLALGNDFGKAMSFYKKVNGLTHLSLGQYREAGNIFKTLNGFLDGGDYEAGTVAKAFADAYGLEVPADDEARRNFIIANIERFRLDTTTETLHKDPVRMVKCGLEDLVVDNMGHLHLDSAKADILTAEQIKVKSAEAREKGDVRPHFLRIVNTSENGFMREAADVLESIGFKGVSVMVYCGDDGNGDAAVAMLLKNKKRELFTNGFVDDATGTHYMFAMRGASMTRKANACFLPGKTWADTFRLWYKISGLKDKAGFVSAFGEKVNFSKMLARLSSRASSSFSLSKVYPEVGEIVRQARVLYVKDRTVKVSKKYHTLTAPNVLENGEGDREITIADGSCYASVSFKALVAKGMRIISDSEFTIGIALWKRHLDNGGTLADVSGALLAFVQKVCIPFQIRTGSWKGMMNTADVETAGISAWSYAEVCTEIPAGHLADELINIGEYDIICPESVRKYQDGGFDKYPLEICGYLKEKKGMVNLNPQFINALEWNNPNALIPIVKDIILQARLSLDDPAKALAFHHIYGEGSEVSSMLGDVLRTDATLINEVQVQSWRYDQYAKLINGLALGRIPVPGTYTYMVADPNAFLNETFGLSLPCLAEGEFFFNGKTCKAGLFRSPLIHPFEAQKAQLIEHPAYAWAKDVALFNIYDGSADSMGGADFDGDTCAVIPDDSWQGNIIVEGIRKVPFDVWEKGAAAKKQYFVPDVDDEEAMSNLINFLVDSSQTDRTGIITNYGTAALELSNHLRGLCYFAKNFGVDTITFAHPKAFGEDAKWGSNYAPRKYGDTLMTKGFVKGRYSKKDKGYVWFDDKELSIVGVKTVDEVLSLSNDYLRLVEIVRVLQGREIDGAKTGVPAEGPRYNPETGEGNDFTDNVKVIFTSKNLVARQFSLGRIQKEDAKSANTYVSLSPWGRVYTYVTEAMAKEDSVLNLLKTNGVVKTAQLVGLLNDEEKAWLSHPFNFNGKQGTFLDYIKAWKDHYAMQMKLFFDAARNSGTNVNNEEQAEDTFGTLSVASIKSQIFEQIEKACEGFGIPMTAVAVACYIANFTKNGSIHEGNSFAWLFAGDLLQVFSRNNQRYQWTRVPENGDISVKSGILYVGSREYRTMEDAHDCGLCLTGYINGRRYAWVRLSVKEVATPKQSGVLYEGVEYIYNLYGFSAYGYSSSVFSRMAGCTVNAIMHKDGSNAGRIELYASNGKEMVPFCSISNSKEAAFNMSLADIDGHTLKIVDVGDVKEKSVVNAKFIVVG